MKMKADVCISANIVARRLFHEKKDDAKYINYGYAIAYHGYLRATTDMDIWIERNFENAGELVHVLKEFVFSDEDIPQEQMP
jgi:hypothetical protein